MKGKKFMTGMLSAALIAGSLATAVSAAELPDTTWTAPTQALAVDSNIIKCGAKACYGTYPQFFGANQVSGRNTDYPGIYNAETAEQAYTTALNVNASNKAPQILHCIGTYSNIDPDPYDWNLLYNIAVDAGAATGEKSSDAINLVSTKGGEDSGTSDEYEGTTGTLVRRPDLLIHSSNSNDEAWVAALPENNDADTTNDYTPSYVVMSTYYTLQNWIDDMYNVADALDNITAKTGKVTRYADEGETPAVISSRYEAYIKGLQYYVNKKINDGTVEKKVVAIIDSTGTDTDGNGTLDTYTLLDSKTSFDSAASCRTALYVDETTTNLIDKLGIKADASGAYTVTAQDMCANADVIMAINGAHVSTTETEVQNNLTAAGVAKADIPDIIAQDPASIFVYTAQSPENGMGIGLYMGRLYPEIINPVYASMYWYENFWHVIPSELEELAGLTFKNASLPAGIEANGAGYTTHNIESKIYEGLKYHEENPDIFKNTTIETLSDRVNIEDYNSGHVLTETKAKAATCVQAGNSDYWTCSICGKVFSDAQGKTEISLADTIIAATGQHTWSAWKTTTAATVLKAGTQKRTCSVCGKTETKSIAKLKATIKLSSTKKSVKAKKSFILTVSKLAKGDAVKSVKSGKTKIAAVKKTKTNKYKITGKKKGKAVITVTLKSGLKAKCTVTVK